MVVIMINAKRDSSYFTKDSLVHFQTPFACVEYWLNFRVG